MAAGARAQIFDQTFNPSPSSAVFAVAAQPDARIWVGGSFTNIGGVSRSNLVRLSASGVVDTTAATVNGSVYAIAVQPDGKILIGGSFSTVGGLARGRLARLNTNGSVDQAFAAEMGAGTVNAIVVQPDGKIVLGGSFSTVGGMPRQNLARVNADGTGDLAFIADAVGFSTPSASLVLALALQEDGGIVVAGQFGTLKGQFRPSLGRLRSDGTLDPAFNGDGTGTPASIAALAIQRDGKILVGGSNFSLGAGRFNVARVNTDGTRDVSFSPIVLNTVTALAVQPDGSVLLGGNFATVDNQPRLGLARILAGGTLDPNFGFSVDGSIAVGQSQVRAIVATADGRVYFGGAFSVFGSSVRNGLARLVPPAPAITAQPASATVAPGATITLSATVVGSAITYQWRKNGTAIAGATNATLTLAVVQPGDAGSYDVVAGNGLGTVTSGAATLTILLPPIIAAQPSSAVVIAGLPVSFSVVASGTPTPGYQWQKDGVNLVGATAASYMIAAVRAADAGVYRCVVSNSGGSVTSAAASLLVLPRARLANVSVRTTLAAAQTVIVGFVVSGGTGDVLLRAAGPALLPFGVATAMADPRIELFRDSTKLLENDNWPSVLGGAFAGVGAFAFPGNSLDAALRQILSGAHSAVVGGTGPGVVLVEAYDIGATEGVRFANVSARNRVGTGDDVLIAGISVGGFGSIRVLVRAVGPTIGGVPFNVPGVLADPRLELRSANGDLIAANDDWTPDLAPVFSSVGAFGLAPGSRDAALQATLASALAYTVIVKGADGGTGVALVEIYEVP